MENLELTLPEFFTMEAAILSGSRRGEIAVIKMNLDGSFINNYENPQNFAPEEVEAAFTDNFFKGRKTTLTLAHDGSVMKAIQPEFTSEEQRLWDELDEASKRAEATAIRAGKTAERIIEKRRRSIAELRANN